MTCSEESLDVLHYTQISPEMVKGLNGPTSRFLCPLSANKFGIDFTGFVLRDVNSKTVLIDIKKVDHVTYHKKITT